MTSAVLIVEDEDMIREMMDITLTQAGYHVTTVADGAAALEVLKHQKVQLVLLDVHMPRMSGLEVLANIKHQVRPTPPVLMVTANRNAEAVTEAMRLGCAGYVAKPFKPSDLVARVRSAMAPPKVDENIVWL
ncbi:response regulator [Brevundimonas sp.]|uniref:response regulator n=1 Tax=Brevundimonas sp. TaxID=1871086 RepID=UPI003562BA4A